MCALFVLIGLFVTAESARILGVVPSPSFSHPVVFRPIWRELSLRGHQVTVLTTDPMNDPSLPNLREIDLHGAYDFWNVKQLSENSKYNVLKDLNDIFAMINKATEFELSHPEVQNLIKNETEYFDLAMIEFLIPAMTTFSARFKCPYIGIVSMDSPYFAHDVMGNPTHPILYPDLQLPFVTPLNFFERVVSVFFRFVTYYCGYFFILPSSQAISYKYFGENIPQLEFIIANISMLFVNTNPILHTVRPLSPGTIQIGGGTHLTPPKKLPEDLQSFLDNAKKGVIYFSLGSNVKSTSISPSLMQTFLEALKAQPYQILWKFDVELPDLPSNIKTIKWGPQQDILRHPNIKLFITQGGLQSMEESLHNHIPVIVIPFFGDQVGNAKLIEKKGFGVHLDKDHLDKDSLIKAIDEVISNPEYKASAKKISELILDQPMTGTEKAVWWAEYVIRHKVVPHLKGHDVPLYQYYFLDIIAFFILIVFIPPLILYKLCKFVVRKVVSFMKSKIKTN